MRVLLVEDDPTTSKSIELMLTHANLNVYTTDLGEEGIDLQHRCESKHVLQCAMIWACYILPSWN